MPPRGVETAVRSVHSRSLARVATLALTLLGCESERLVAQPGPSDPLSDAATPRTDADLADADAPAPDAKLRDDASTFDARPDDALTLDAGTPDSGEELQPDAGPASIAPGVLIADPVGNQIIHLAPNGALIRAYRSPIDAVSAVALDRRLRDGFWIGGRGNTNPLFTKLDWSGAVIETRDYPADRLFQFLPEGIRAVDYGLGASASGDSLPFLFTNSNAADVVAVGYATTVGWSGETGIGLRVGYQGISLIDVTVTAPQTLQYWTTQGGRIERWQWAANQPTATITTALDIGGIETARDGTFWVTDRASRAVVHLDVTGARLGVPIAVPAAAVADLSLIE